MMKMCIYIVTAFNVRNRQEAESSNFFGVVLLGSFEKSLKLTIHLHLVMRSEICGAIPLLRTHLHNLVLT
jgi:hypothetical protein